MEQPAARLAKLPESLHRLPLQEDIHIRIPARDSEEARWLPEELSAYLPDKGSSPETTVELKELAAALSTFLHNLPDRERNVFMARYWYVMPINDISARLSLNINTVKTILRRTRQKLVRYLEKEGLT